MIKTIMYSFSIAVLASFSLIGALAQNDIDLEELNENDALAFDIDKVAIDVVGGEKCPICKLKFYITEFISDHLSASRVNLATFSYKGEEYTAERLSENEWTVSKN